MLKEEPKSAARVRQKGFCDVLAIPGSFFNMISSTHKLP